jgi:hypothetical protein
MPGWYAAAMTTFAVPSITDRAKLRSVCCRDSGGFSGSFGVGSLVSGVDAG